MKKREQKTFRDCALPCLREVIFSTGPQWTNSSLQTGVGSTAKGSPKLDGPRIMLLWMLFMTPSLATCFIYKTSNLVRPKDQFIIPEIQYLYLSRNIPKYCEKYLFNCVVQVGGVEHHLLIYSVSGCLNIGIQNMVSHKLHSGHS